MRIGIIGSGALGLYYGAMLQRGGAEVNYLLRRDYEAITNSGLQVFSVNGDFHLPQINGYRSAEEIGQVDLVLVGLKTFANDHLIDLVRPLVGPETLILSLQNGLGNEELLASAFNPEQILGGVAFLCSNRGEPGEVHHLGLGSIRLANHASEDMSRCKRLSEIFSDAGVPCEASNDLLRIRWEKLVWNIPFNGLCALTGKDVTELLEHPPTRELVCEMMQEVICAANLQSLKSPIEADPFIDQMITASDGMDHYRPSMMIDRIEGRRLELDAIYNIPLQRAATAGRPMIRVDTMLRCLSVGEAD